jgi:hypothetical protein
LAAITRYRRVGRELTLKGNPVRKIDRTQQYAVRFLSEIFDKYEHEPEQERVKRKLVRPKESQYRSRKPALSENARKTRH